MVDTTTMFFHELRQFGGARAKVRMKHRERIRKFTLRQQQLGAMGFLFVAAFLITSVFLFALLAVLCFSTATGECRRMRACGRYWQCKRSIEVIGI